MYPLELKPIYTIDIFLNRYENRDLDPPHTGMYPLELKPIYTIDIFLNRYKTLPLLASEHFP
jgi:hypothetical protein